MPLNTETSAVLWLGAGAVLLWKVLPAVLNALGLTFCHSSIEDDPAALEPSGDDAEYDDLFAQLRGNGFYPVGRRSTTCWLFLHHWYKNFQSRVFAARQGDCIALAYRLRPWDRWRLCFVTAFSDGAILETANQMEGFRIEEPDHLRWGLATPDRGELLERHRAACRDFAAADSRSVARLPAEEVNRLIWHHEMRYHRQHNRWMGLALVAVSLVFLGVALLPLAWFARTAPYVLPVGVIAWGFAWPAFHAALFRAAARSFQAEDARRHGNQPTAGRAGGGRE